jgi:hypothetical protein
MLNHTAATATVALADTTIMVDTLHVAVIHSIMIS